MKSKAELIITPSNLDSGGVVTKIPLHFNPPKIDVSRGRKIERAANTGANQQNGRVASLEPITLKLDALMFDTYESRKSVRDTVIDKLEDAIVAGGGDDDDSVYTIIRFNWGQFTSSRHDSHYQFLLRGFDCSYTMFLEDGTPVRATVTLRLEQYVPDKEEAKVKRKTTEQVHQVRAGETAQSIATLVYGDPRRWRPLCKANGIDDPMSIEAGSQLLIPPARSGDSQWA